MAPLKKTIDDLAFFGGSPAFQRQLHVGRPNLGNRESLMKRLEDIFNRRWLTNAGPLVQELEKQVAEYIGVKHCIAVCNATVGLEIAIRAAGLEGEVIVPSFTFIATPHSLQWQEITPVFCDVEPETHLLDPERVEELITPRTTGILGVHTWGRACHVERLLEIASRRKLRLLFDAAHAFGCSHRGRRIGGFGDAEVFSFHATKFFNSAEGGAIVTNDDALAKTARLMTNFGYAGLDRVIAVGTNGKMSELSAAMGLTNFESIDAFIETNRRHYERYRERLSGMPGIRMLAYPGGESWNYQYIVLEVDSKDAILTRDQIVDLLWAENVLSRRYFFPGCHRQEPYRSYFPQAGLHLPVTERLSTQVMTLPTGTDLATADIDVICEVLQAAMRFKREISVRMSSPAFRKAG